VLVELQMPLDGRQRAANAQIGRYQQNVQNLVWIGTIAAKKPLAS
jgi:hypothetical protein